MIGKIFLLVVLVFSAHAAIAQTPSASPAQGQTRPAVTFDLSEFGVQLQPDSRLIIMMAALDAAGFDPTPAGKQSSPFRQLVRKDQAALDADLRERMTN